MNVFLTIFGLALDLDSKLTALNTIMRLVHCSEGQGESSHAPKPGELNLGHPPASLSIRADASRQVVIAVIPPRVVKKIRPGAEAVTADHPTGSLQIT